MGSSVRCKTDSVVSRIGSGECEASGRGAELLDNAMMVVEDFLDGDVNTNVWVGGVGIREGVKLLDLVVSYGTLVA